MVDGLTWEVKVTLVPWNIGLWKEVW